MAIRSDLLDLLACPKCKGAVFLDDETPAIVCAACKLRFPVRDDIPIMLIDEATSF